MRFGIYAQRMVADFMARAREILAGGGDETSLDAVGRLLSESSREPGFIPQTEMKTLHGGDTTSAGVLNEPPAPPPPVGRSSPPAGSARPQNRTPAGGVSGW